MNVATFNGWPERRTCETYFHSFQPFLCTKTGFDSSRILETLGRYDEEVEFSCQDKVSMEFRGDPTERETVRLSMKTFVDAMTDLQSDRLHWTHTLDFNLYLAQFPIYDGQIKGPLTMQTLKDIYKTPDILMKEDMQTVNLWMNLFRARSSLHYDSFHNLLIVTSGCKHVRLVSPAHTALLQPYEASKSAPNHSHLSSQSIFEKSLEERIQPIDLVLGPGDALFLPEGWWHIVESDPCTVAINFWFLSPWGKLLSHPHMCPYLLRSALHECVQLASQDTPIKDKLDTDSATTSDVPPGQDIRNTRKRSLESTEALDDEDIPYSHFKSQLRQLALLGSVSEASQIDEKENMTATDMEQELVLMPFDSMRVMWPRFAKEFPDEWADSLLSLSPAAVHALTKRWEEIESNVDGVPSSSSSSSTATTTATATATAQVLASCSSQAMDLDTFFAGIYEPLGDRAMDVRRHFISQKDAFLRDICRGILDSVLKIA